MKQHPFAILLALAISILLMPFASSGEPQAKVHRVGMLMASAPSATWRAQPWLKAFIDGLGDLGYVEGRNLVIEFRSAESKFDRLPELAAELAGLRLDAILVGTCGALLDSMRRADSTVPIVVGACTDDMVAAGIVASLAHPGGNVTGLQKLAPELSTKRLELMKQVLPHASRVAVLWNPDYSDATADWRALRGAARTLGVTLLPVEAPRAGADRTCLRHYRRRARRGFDHPLGPCFLQSPPTPCGPRREKPASGNGPL
jgi:putative ABC transport system substrate-binding protein